MPVVLAFCLMLIGVAFGGAPSATAQPIPWIGVKVGMGQPSVEGYAWPDATVDVLRNGVVVLDNLPVSGAFFAPLPTAAVPGDTFDVVGATTTKSVTVVALDVDVYDVATATLHGNKGASPPWGDLRVSVGNMYGHGGSTTVSADAETTWSATLSADAFDLMAGVGVMLEQSDLEGDFLGFQHQVPNPMIQLETSGVSVRGWWPDSELTVYLDDDPGDGIDFPYQYTIQTDSSGSYCCAPAPDPAWAIAAPGWRAKVVGAYPTRDNGTVTKEIAFPSVPMPTASGNVVSGSVPGTLTGASVGAGSYVQGDATCPDGSVPGRIGFATGGTYSLDFGAIANAPWGWGDPCAGDLYYYGTHLRDLDGDEFATSWFVDGKFDATHPALSVVNPVLDTGDLAFVGTGWDLTVVRVQQCELVDGGGGTVPGECDPSTTYVKTTYPDWDHPDGWPAGMARIDDVTSAKQVLELSGGRTVDCAAAPGTCALRVEEVYRSSIVAWAPLDYIVTDQIVLDVEVAPKGIATRTGKAVVKGTVKASEAKWVHVFGKVVQRQSPTRVVTGSFSTWVNVRYPDTLRSWQVTVKAWSGKVFRPGYATVTAWADLSDASLTEGDLDIQSVWLRRP